MAIPFLANSIGGDPYTLTKLGGALANSRKEMQPSRDHAATDVVLTEEPHESFDESLRRMYHLAERALQESLIRSDKLKAVTLHMSEIAKVVPTNVRKAEQQYQTHDTAAGHKLLGMLGQVQKASEDLEAFIQSSSSFMGWWADMEQSFGGIISAIKPGPPNPLKGDSASDISRHTPHQVKQRDGKQHVSTDIKETNRKPEEKEKQENSEDRQQGKRRTSFDLKETLGRLSR